MRHGSLFSGIGGFDLAAEWMGWENVFHCEWNEFGQKILKYYWPNAISYGDITKTDFNVHRGKIDIITGGFPCQPFSKAGKQKGINDDRFLWPEMLRAIKEIRPCWVVGENVTGIKNMALDMVLSSLENIGYKTETFIIPASAIGTWHRRERIWIIAYSSSYRSYKHEFTKRRNINKVSPAFSKNIKLTDFDIEGMERYAGHEYSRQEWEIKIGRNGESYWPLFWDEVAPGFCRDNDGVPNRVDRIKALGNAIVPQVAYEIFKAIEKCNT